VTSATETVDVAIVGAGAAGLAAALFAARRAPALRIRCFDGARTIGAKILVSGGSRCNVTNREVSERDFWGGSRRVVRSVLRAFPAARTAAFFRELGVALHEEEDGKLFPDSNRSRDVLDALVADAGRLGVAIATGERIDAVHRETGGGFAVETRGGRRHAARAVVLATGGRSLPKTGSDGGGYTLATRLGHGYVETTPALAPLLLDSVWHTRLAGVSHPAALTLRAAGEPPVRLEGSLLWTHFGASGPVVLNASRHWHRVVLEQRPIEVQVSLLPADAFEQCDAWLQEQQRLRPRALLGTVLATRLPAAVADVWLEIAGCGAETTMAHLTRAARRGLAHALVATPLGVRDSRGYGYAEVTAGGVPLDEIDPATMESRCCPGLYLVGEILDVDGRLGGFNFQWAWSSAFVAGQAIARTLA
jgi:predicted Rossmann fold flavoprotein